MRHINLTTENKDDLAEYMITQESNNFGDQILTLKKLEVYTSRTKLKHTQYVVIAITSRQEGDWMSKSDMIVWLNNIKRMS